MSLYSRFCGLETTKTPSGTGEAVLFFKVLRRFFDAEKPIERFATFPQPHLKPSTALCAVSQ
jgi:hypothetical protein